MPHFLQERTHCFGQTAKDATSGNECVRGKKGDRWIQTKRLADRLLDRRRKRRRKEAYILYDLRFFCLACFSTFLHRAQTNQEIDSLRTSRCHSLDVWEPYDDVISARTWSTILWRTDLTSGKFNSLYDSVADCSKYCTWDWLKLGVRTWIQG